MKVVNRRAHHDYYLYESIEAGLSLTGNEVKSLLEGRGDLSSSFVRIRDGEAYLVGANIPPYGAPLEHDSLRLRKLLLKKGEILSLESRMRAGNLTLVPTLIYNKGRLIKAKLTLAKGKKQFEKRDSKRKKDISRETEIALKDRLRGR